MSTDVAGGAAGVEEEFHQQETRNGLWVLPLLVGVVFAGWLVWRLQANLDSTALGELGWGALRDHTIEHLKLTFVSTVFVLLIAVPLGIMLTRPGIKRLAPAVLSVANAGQAAPSIGLFVLLAIWLGFGFWTAIIALTLYAILPVLRNTIVGLEGVDATLVEAGRGMGMSGAGVLLRIELPLALPVIMAGVRIALVLLVGTATFGTFIAAGGLGSAIVVGIALFKFEVIVSGALLIALLALLIDWAGRVLEYVLRPKGL